MIFSSKKDLEESVRGLVKENVYNAFKKVDRKLFVPEKWQEFAYTDSSISLDKNSSISQPTLVAEMIDLLGLKGDEHVLEIGTGSGYSAAILSLCCKKVETIEIVPELASSARKRLKLLGFKNVSVFMRDGSFGLPEKAPFEGIIVNAEVKEIPSALILQLKEEGKIVIPVEVKDSSMQKLFLCLREKNKLSCEVIGVVRFVPLI